MAPLALRDCEAALGDFFLDLLAWLPEEQIRRDRCAENGHQRCDIRGVGREVGLDPARDDEALARALTYVDGLVSRLRAAGVNARGEARTVDDVPAGIVGAAGALETDLIVMSTHGLTGLPRAVLGSVADAVVRTASCYRSRGSVRADRDGII